MRLNLRDHDVQYRARRSSEKLEPQLARLAAILEENFLNRWAYRVEVRNKLMRILMSLRESFHTSAYALLLKNAPVLERAGALERRSGVRHRLGELLGRPLSDREIVVEGTPSNRLEADLELKLALGAHGALIVDRGSISPTLGVMLVEEASPAARWLSRSRLRNLSEKEFNLSEMGSAPGTFARALAKKG